MPQRSNRSELARAAMNREQDRSGAGLSQLQAAMSQFMQSFTRSMDKLTKQVGQAQSDQSQQAQNSMAQIADVAERQFNKATQQAETRRQESRQEALMADERRYSQERADYERALQKQTQQDAKEVGLIMNELEQAKLRAIGKHERDIAKIQGVLADQRDWVNRMDENHYWDLLPDGKAQRKRTLDYIRMAQVVREDMDNSPYTDRVSAMVAQQKMAVLQGSQEYDVPVPLDSAAVPVPAVMLDSLDIDLPVFDPEEMDQWDRRNGYPKGGLWALKTDDPRMALVNPVGFAAMTKAQQDDTFLALSQAQDAQREYLIGQARAQREFDRWAGPIEESSVEQGKAWTTTAPDAIATVLSPANWDTDGPSDPMIMLTRIHSEMTKSPELARKVWRIGLPDDNSEKFMPGRTDKGQEPDPAKAAQDFADAMQIETASTVLDKLTGNPFDSETGLNPLRASVSQWLDALSEAQVWDVGLPHDVASALAEAKRKHRQGPGVAERLSRGFQVGTFQMEPGAPRPLPLDAAIRERAITGVLSAWNRVNRNEVLVPARASNPLTSWRDSMHSSAALGDMTATALLSRMRPEELQALGEAGQLPPEVEALGYEGGMFRRPLGLLESIGTIMNARPGARSSLDKLMRGGLTDDEEQVYDNPQNNEVRAYYEGVHDGQIPLVPPGPGQNIMGRPPVRPYMDTVKRQQEGRSRMRSQAGQSGPGEAAQPATTPAPTQGASGVQPPAQPPAQQPASPAGATPPAMGQPSQPLGQAGQLAPTPANGPSRPEPTPNPPGGF